MPSFIERFAAHRAARTAATAESSANSHWDALLRDASGQIFRVPSDADVAACRRVADAYRPILDGYGIPHDEFFGGSIKDQDAAAIYAIVRERCPRRAYQVGTFVGYSALVIASALRENGEGVVVCCDPEIPHRTFINPVDVARDMAQVLGLEEHVRFERGWHAVPIGDDFSQSFSREIPVRGPDALRTLGEVEFAFVDGDHSLSATICDLMLIQQHLAVGGVAVFHDVKSWPSVAHALHAFRSDIYFYREGTRAFFDFDAFDGPDGLVAIERRKAVCKPLLCLRVVAPDGRPIVQAEVALPERSFSARTGRDGRVFYFGDANEATRLRVASPGFEPADDALGVCTAGDYAERTVRLAPRT